MNKIVIQGQITVNAPINKVWEAIQNPTIHVEWHPLVTHIAGEHKPGAIRKCDVNLISERKRDIPKNAVRFMKKGKKFYGESKKILPDFRIWYPIGPLVSV